MKIVGIPRNHITVNKWIPLALALALIPVIAWLMLVGFELGYECGWHDQIDHQKRIAEANKQIAGAEYTGPSRRFK